MATNKGPTRIEFTGDVALFKQFLNPNVWRGNLEREIRKATIANALFLIREVKKNIREEKFEPNSELTLALALRGNKTLIKESNLFRAIEKKIFNSFIAEVGIIGNNKSTGGITGQTIPMKKLVELMESGYTITVTDAMVAAITARLNEKTQGKKGKLTKKAAAGLATIGAGQGKTFTVPERPIFSKVFVNNPRIERVIQANWRSALEGTFKFQGAKDGEHRDR